MDTSLSVIDSRGSSWRNWIIENIKRGCTDTTIVKEMISKGVWTLQEATQAVAYVHESINNEIYRLPTIPYLNSINIDSQEIKVTGRVNKPKATLLENLLSKEECLELIRLATLKGLNRSMVADNTNGGNILSEGRTSTIVHFTLDENILVSTISTRIAKLTDWATNKAEGIQILCYEEGQQYKPHFDWFDPNVSGTAVHLGASGQRVGTTVIYLATSESGGCTSFPDSGLEFCPSVGGAVFFNSVDSNGLPDRSTLHAATPVVRGVKIVAVYWQREKAF